MSRHFDNAPSAVLPSLIATALYASGIWFCRPEVSWASIAAAAALIAGTCFVLLASSRSFSASTLPSIALVYLILVGCNANALVFDNLHVAALLYALSMLSLLSEGDAGSLRGIGSRAGAGAIITLASFFFPPLIWMAVPAFCLIIGSASDKSRFTTAYLSAIVMTIAVYAGIIYLRSSLPEMLEKLSGYGLAIITVPGRNLHISPAVFVSLALIATGAATATTMMLKELRRSSISRRATSTCSIIYLLCTLVICLIFGGDLSKPYGLIVNLPLSMILGSFLSESRPSSVRTALIFIFIVIIIAERTLLLIN